MGDLSNKGTLNMSGSGFVQSVPFIAPTFAAPQSYKPDFTGESAYSKYLREAGSKFALNFKASVPDFSLDSSKNFGTPSTESTPFFKNYEAIGAYTGLASALTGLAGFGAQKDLLKTQTKGLKQNIAFAREDQNRRRGNISGFNSFDAGNRSQTSSMVS